MTWNQANQTSGVAGTPVDPTSAGGTLIDLGSEISQSQQADIGVLVDGIGGTVDLSLAAITDPADAPATADVLREDLVANALPELRDALSSIADQVNDIRTALRNLTLMA